MSVFGLFVTAFILTTVVGVISLILPDDHKFKTFGLISTIVLFVIEVTLLLILIL